MDEYKLGRDIANFERELATTQQLLQEMYAIIEFNLGKGKLEAPKEEKKK